MSAIAERIARHHAHDALMPRMRDDCRRVATPRYAGDAICFYCQARDRFKTCELFHHAEL